MMTPPPVNAGTPHLFGEPPRSYQNNRVLLDQLLHTLGHLMDVASLGAGCMSCDMAEWAGTTLIRWAEQDRAEWRNMTNPTRVAALARED